MTLTAVILAAGLGKRMHSNLPKVLHPLAGRPLIEYSLETCARLSNELPVVVVGNGADQVRKTVGDRARFVLQPQLSGTANALQAAQDVLAGQIGRVLVISADMPLLRDETLQRLVETQGRNPGKMSLLTVTAENPRGFGRIVRAADGSVAAIVEEAQANAEQLQIHELNVAAYCFEADWLWDALRQVKISPKGEYYLTDLVEISVNQGYPVGSLAVEDAAEAMGINTRVHLAEAESLLRRRINTAWMLAGVTLVDPASIYIDPGVTIGQDTVIWPNTFLRGKTSIGENCRIGPNSIIEDTLIGNRCTILASVMEKAVVEDGVGMGPFVHLRKGAHLAEGVHMGNFGEVKNSYLGPGTKMGHFSYIGDAQIGPDVNIGAGTITCNYDGNDKFPTQIGAGAFIGSDTMLVAPVKIGEGSITAAGSVVTHDVEPHTLVKGVPARPFRKLEAGE
jgi:bifunctional UDP-N-acetylglucosamine pyrophosphorylase / glucosamine-1-phosphate N-acetyltransferase